MTNPVKDLKTLLTDAGERYRIGRVTAVAANGRLTLETETDAEKYAWGRGGEQVGDWVLAKGGQALGVIDREAVETIFVP